MKSLRDTLALILLALVAATPSFAAPDDGAPNPACALALAPARTPGLALRLVPGATDWGPRREIKARENARDIDSIQTLRIGQYNVENLLERVGQYARDPRTGNFVLDPATNVYKLNLPRLKKSDSEVHGVAFTIHRAGTDINIVEEVESLGALEVLNRDHLGNDYIPEVIEGNDIRGIDVGEMFKGDLPFDYVTQSFKNVAHPSGEHPLFSRDFPVTEVRPAGADPATRPLFIIAGTHFKSQRPEPGDPTSDILRGEQAEGCAAILTWYQARWGADVPIFVAGDFNKDVRTGKEFQPIWEAGYTDGFTLAPADKQIPKSERVTHVFFPKGAGGRIENQLDSISGNQAVRRLGLVLDMQIVPYLGPSGIPLPPARTYDERQLQPSDHRMIYMEIDFAKILAAYREALGAGPGQRAK